MRASIIVPLYNQVGFTKVCMEYLLRNTAMDGMEVILVDNASSDGTSAYVAGLPKDKVRCIRNEMNLGFAKACNQGARDAQGRWLIFLNNDTAPHRGWLPALLEPLERRPDVGIAGPKLIYPDGTIQQAGVVFSGVGLPYHLYTGCDGNLPGANRARYFRSVTGACFAIAREEFLGFSGFDERYLNGLEDIDLCLRLDQKRRGIFYTPASVVTHFESRSENRQARMDDNARLFVATWGIEGRHDDYRYLAQDGMGICVSPENRIEFFSLEEIARMSGPDMDKAEALARQGQAAKSLGIFKDILSRMPYNLDAVRRVATVAARFGLSDLASAFRDKAESMSADCAGYGSDMLPAVPGEAAQPAAARAAAVSRTVS